MSCNYNKGNNFNLSMINPLIKNCRTGFHDDILNRTSHYKKLLQSKSKIDNQMDKIYLSASNKQINRQSESNNGEDNLRIFKKLMAIQKKTPRYITDGVNYEQSHKKTLKSYYKQRQKSLIISEENVRLLKKIENIESDFSLKKIDAINHSHQKKCIKNAEELKKIRKIDDFYYKSFRLEMFRERIESKLERINDKKSRNRDKKKSKYRFSTLNAHEESSLGKQPTTKLQNM